MKNELYLSFDMPHNAISSIKPFLKSPPRNDLHPSEFPQAFALSSAFITFDLEF